MMARIVSKSIVAIALASVSLASASPALARHNNYGGYYQNGRDGYFRSSGYDNRGYDNRGYDNRSNDYRWDSNWRGNRCDKGTGGTIIGAIAGGLLGSAIVGRRGDKTAGVIVGAGAGALAGRALDRSDSNNRC
jgi:Glycine zipper 2TM domain